MANSKSIVVNITPDTSNTLFQIAKDLVNQSNRNLFITGKAGTGKTTFLKYIRETCPKQMVVVAPTGVAAINAGGVTIHSFFQIPPCTFLPTLQHTGFTTSHTDLLNRHSLPSRLRFNREKRKIFQQLELLIIDEISMVRCDLLDAIDTVLRFVRKRQFEKFGGVQVVFIGDMFQLSPVVKDSEWNILSNYYSSAYFFDSMVLREEPPIFVEFDKIYRQNDEDFISLLNQVRNNALDEKGLMILESRYNPSIRRSKDDGYIILTTHSEQARATNYSQLQRLNTAALQYDSLKEGDFPESAFPAEETLFLKTGAQVMFIKNDTADRGKRYFNGKIGIIKKLENDNILVQCDGDIEIRVEREKWENCRYSFDIASQKLKEEVIGSFTQFPLRLAWAITIHKSQGLTFKKAIIDAGEAFAPGQVYVALSRCTSLDGLILKSKVRTGSLLTDPKIIQFNQSISTSIHLEKELIRAKKDYKLKILVDTFTYATAFNYSIALKVYIYQNTTSFNPEASTWIDQLQEQLIELQKTAEKFHNWLRSQFLQEGVPEDNHALLERTGKAAIHFISELEKISEYLKKTSIITDSKLHAKECNQSLLDIFAVLAEKKYLLQNFSGCMDIAAWHKHKKIFVLPAFTVNIYSGAATQKTNSPHPALFMQLKKQRDNFCDQKGLPVYMVANTQTLNEMACYLPHSLVELKKISGMGDAKIGQYGHQFLDIILEYCRENELSSKIHDKAPKRERKQKADGTNKPGDTHAESFGLFKKGKSISEIASERKLTIGTIEGHLCKYISSGDLNIEEVVSREKVEMINGALKDYEGLATGPIKGKLPPEISYGEIRMVMTALKLSKD